MKKTAFILGILLLSACTPSWKPSGVENLVVEGWIESGDFPVVMVTTTVPTSTEYQNWDDLRSHLVRWAKVSVSDGQESVVLTGMPDKRYFPPYVYTTTRMRGVPGKKYSLTVEYGGEVVNAVTSIPFPVALDSVRVRPAGDGSFEVMACFNDNPEEKNYYKLFTRVVGRDSIFVPSLPGELDDAVIHGPVSVPVFKGRTFTNMEKETGFSGGEVVDVRLCTMDAASYAFWKSYSRMASMSSSPVFPAEYNPESNIDGALGCWCGYGVSVKRVVVE